LVSVKSIGYDFYPRMTELPLNHPIGQNLPKTPTKGKQLVEKLDGLQCHSVDMDAFTTSTVYCDLDL